MKTIELKEQMVSDLIKEIRAGAVNEIAAFQRAEVRVEEVKILRKEYADTAENLREKVKKMAPNGTDVGQIKTFFKSKNQVARELQETEETIKEIDEKFLPGASDELSVARDSSCAFVGSVAFRLKRPWQQKVDDLCAQINAIRDGWKDALLLIGHNQGIPAMSSNRLQTVGALELSVLKDAIPDSHLMALAMAKAAVLNMEK